MTETFEHYTARMLALAGDDDPLGVMAETPARIGRLIAGRSAADLQRSPGPGRWSIAEILGHLADAEIVLGYRARMILAAPGTAIQAFNQDAFVQSQHAASSKRISGSGCPLIRQRDFSVFGRNSRRAAW